MKRWECEPRLRPNGDITVFSVPGLVVRYEEVSPGTFQIRRTEEEGWDDPEAEQLRGVRSIW